MAAPEVCARWFRYAIGDLETARAILSDERLPPREAAYLAHQAADKALKAAILQDAAEPPWTHDLPFLRSQAPAAVRAAAHGIDLRPLWAAATAARYPETDDQPYERDEIVALVSDAAAIVDIVRRYLDDAGLDASEMTLE